ncbi:MAG: hypothetical protein JAY94_14665 [Candidatus Thiodiazotropha endolucinida]|nr:hypothetical protein [Candidatus Thiodiazotropha taylori]MCG8085590.1 hypothetical protein [Candidatus Thiodiazotropha taylori]MCW4318754.1 hypothetical protein [Candidatus Thiodiazotropha taylori]
MYDLGIYRLEQYVESKYVGSDLGIVRTLVLPDFHKEYPGEDEIVITLYYKSSLLEDSQEKCAKIINEFRELEFHSPYDHSSEINSFFMHNHFIRKGYDMNSKGDRDVKFSKAVANLFTIAAIDGDNRLRCYGPHIGKEITFNNL